MCSAPYVALPRIVAVTACHDISAQLGKQLCSLQTGDESQDRSLMSIFVGSRRLERSSVWFRRHCSLRMLDTGALSLETKIQDIRLHTEFTEDETACLLRPADDNKRMIYRLTRLLLTYRKDGKSFCNEGESGRLNKMWKGWKGNELVNKPNLRYLGWHDGALIAEVCPEEELPGNGGSAK